MVPYIYPGYTPYYTPTWPTYGNWQWQGGHTTNYPYASWQWQGGHATNYPYTTQSSPGTDWFSRSPVKPGTNFIAQEAPTPSYKTSQSRAQTGPSEVRARHILVKTRKEAEKYRRQILAGKRFEDIARKVSQCPSKTKGGDLGFFGKGEMVPEFEQAAFSLPVGAVSQPIQTDFGWHLIQVVEQR